MAVATRGPVNGDPCERSLVVDRAHVCKALLNELLGLLGLAEQRQVGVERRFCRLIEVIGVGVGDDDGVVGQLEISKLESVPVIDPREPSEDQLSKLDDQFRELCKNDEDSRE